MTLKTPAHMCDLGVHSAKMLDTLLKFESLSLAASVVTDIIL